MPVLSIYVRNTITSLIERSRLKSPAFIHNHCFSILPVQVLQFVLMYITTHAQCIKNVIK